MTTTLPLIHDPDSDWEVVIPQRSPRIEGWLGQGWVEYRPSDGNSGWMINGYIHGGSGGQATTTPLSQIVDRLISGLDWTGRIELSAADSARLAGRARLLASLMGTDEFDTLRVLVMLASAMGSSSAAELLADDVIARYLVATNSQRVEDAAGYDVIIKRDELDSKLREKHPEVQLAEVGQLLDRDDGGALEIWSANGGRYRVYVGTKSTAPFAGRLLIAVVRREQVITAYVPGTVQGADLYCQWRYVASFIVQGSPRLRWPYHAFGLIPHAVPNPKQHVISGGLAVLGSGGTYAQC
ncbi:MAG: hypothetical protein HYU28_06370 [Actinobacteria bacterium]|nr:hypothetical protein [Actinomycetota bacterium]